LRCESLERQSTCGARPFEAEEKAMVPVELEIRLLGQANALSAGVPLKFAKRTTTLAMLCLLVLRRGQPVTRAFLAYTLFPDCEEEQALTELRRYLYLAGKTLPSPRNGEPWLVVDAETIRWNEASAAFIDVVEFERLAADESSYAAAVDLYGGDLLEDSYDDWIVAERERLRTLYLARLGDLVERHRGARDYSTALGYANRILAADCWREDVVRQVMSIRYASGDASGALAEFDRFAKRLREEMGVAPMPDTLAVRDVIFCGGPLVGSVDRVSQEEREFSRRAHTLPFIGRERERERLIARFDRAARGFGNSVFIAGEAGVGKSRLVGELARAVEMQGGRVYSGGTSSPESAPYQSIAEALRSALPILALNPANALSLRVLSRVFPELPLEDGAVPALGTLAPERETARLFGAFANAVLALASPRPVLIVFEDLHWASASTIDALATICRRIDRARVLIAVTYRDEEVGSAHALRRLVNALGSERRIAEVAFERFDRDDVRRLVAATPGLAAEDAGLADRLHAFSEGNALFLNQAIADVLERDAALDAAPERPVRGIGNLIASRIARLSDAARAVAEIAAACGEGCNVDVVRDVAGLKAAETLDAFDELLDRGLVREASARDRFDYVFTHNLIARSIYQRMEPRSRVRRHARLAHVIERQAELAARDVRELGRHYEGAERPGTASRWYLRAAREAAALYANDDTIRLTSRAIELADDAAIRMEALLLREEANARLGNRDARASDLVVLESLAQDADLRCRVARRVVVLRHGGDDRELERAAVVRFHAEAAASGSEVWMALAALSEAKLCLALGRYNEAKTHVLASLPQLEAQAPSERIDALMTLIEADVSLGNFAEAERGIADARTIADASGDRGAISEVIARGVTLAMSAQLFEQALAGAKDALEHFRILGDRVGEARALSNIAAASVRLSHWQDAREANIAAAAISESIGDRHGAARAQMNLGSLLTRCGDLAGARELVQAAREHHVRSGDRRALTASFVNEGFMALWQGDAGAAKLLSTDALRLAREMDHESFIAASLANLGAAERDLGEFDAAIAHMEEGLAIAVRLDRLSDAVGDLADIALAHAMSGDLAAACARSEQVLTIDEAWTKSAVFPPYPLWVVACVLHWSDDERANEVCARSWRLSTTFAQSIEAPELRGCFEALPFFVGARAVLEERRWPAAPQAVRTAHASALS
jgi:predicted ATPase/DNA-binding SARP family transcriptional activator